MIETDIAMKMKNIFLLSFLSMAVMMGCADDISGQVGQEKPDAEESDAYGASLTLSMRYMVSAGEEGIQGYTPMSWPEEASVSVNGVCFTKTAKAFADTTLSQFVCEEEIASPYYVTSPYAASSSAQSPKVNIQKNQIVAPELPVQSFLPFCGYSEKNTIVLRHLAGGFSLPVRSTGGTSVITKVVLSAGEAKIAGEFDVDCVNATMTPCENAVSEITYYYITEGKLVSPGKDAVLDLYLPAGEYSDCKAEIYNQSGAFMEVSFPRASVKAGALAMLDAVEYVPGSSVIVSMPGGNKASGFVKDTSGKPVEGVAVTDGFTVVRTDANGYYCINSVSTDAWFIYYSTPAEYEVAVNSYGQPCFWKEYVPGETTYDFTLTPLSSGKEKTFALFTFGDPQVYSNNNYNRFINEAVPGIKAHASTFDIPVYGMGLGDIVFNTDNYKTTYQMPKMRDGFSVSSVGMPVFQVLGNHDQNEYDAQNPLTTDARNSDINIKAQRDYEAVFGPADYSFDRSDVHIIGIRNVIFSSATTSGTGHYHGGFTDRQFEWLKQDLALVPKDKHIIICFHIPLYDCKDMNIASLNTGTNISNVKNLLAQYDKVSIMTGHVHTQHNYRHSPTMMEYNAASLAGAWWNCCVCGDGTPNGFNVYVMEGNVMKDAYYYGYTASSSKRSHQMRLYRGNAVTGAAISGDNKNGTAGYYGFNFAEDVILANVYNASDDWKISVYEDGVYSGDMKLVSSAQPAIGSLVGDYTFSNPRRAADGVETGHDFWVTGYLMGVLGRTTANGGYQNCYHMYSYKLKDKNADIEVVAQDPWGNKYSETVITEGTDVSAALKP